MRYDVRGKIENCMMRLKMFTFPPSLATKTEVAKSVLRTDGSVTAKKLYKDPRGES